MAFRSTESGVTELFRSPKCGLQGPVHDMNEPLLDIRDLSIGYDVGSGHRTIVDRLSLAIRPGEVVALVGESGSGKSITARALMRLLPPGLKTNGGTIVFRGENLVALPEHRMCNLRGGAIAMIYQQPQSMLDPTSRIGVQVAESLSLHRGIDRAKARARMAELFAEVGISEPLLRLDAFPYQLSGGMAQRAMIAAALSADPALIVADEPTTALDVTVQAQIIALLDRERKKRGLSILLITHDLSIVSTIADRIAVIYSGRIVEEGDTRSILDAPKHPYTKGLIKSSLLETDENGQLFSIPPDPASTSSKPAGCAFYPRCTASAECADQCSSREPTLDAVDETRKVRCWAVK